MSILHTFPLAVIEDATGKTLHETAHFKGYIPQKLEYFTVNNSVRYRVLQREFFYNADMEVIAVELIVVVLG